MSTEFKRLNLDRVRLVELVSTAVPGVTAGPLIKNGNAHQCELKHLDGRVGIIQFFYNEDGTTTIKHKVGKHPDVSLAVAEAVRARGVLHESARVDLSFKGRTQVEVDYLLEYLQTQAGAKKTEEKAETHSKMHRVTGLNGDSLVIKFFSNGTLQLQGRPLLLFREAQSFLAAYLNLDEVFQCQVAEFKLDIKPSNILDELCGRLVNSHPFLGETLLKVMSPALVLNKVLVSCDDYSAFAFPALKGLEGYIKKLFLSKRIQIANSPGFKDHFDINSTGSSFLLVKETRDTIICPHTCSAIQEAYTYFNKNRHGLFHAASLPEATRLIPQKSEADDIINTVFDLIERTYSSLPTRNS